MPHSNTTLLEITDAHGGSSAVIAPARGAIVTSFRAAGRELLYLDQATFDDPAKNVRGGVPVLFPSPGKLLDDRWQWQGQAGAMKQHGFGRTLPWQVVAAGPVAKLALQSDAKTLAQYPWPFAAELEFSLRGACLRIVTRVRNTGTESMPFGLGFHPYFRIDDKARVKVETDATRAFDSVTRQEIAFSGFDLTAAEVDMRLMDHTLHHSSLELADGARIVVRASPEFRQWVVWTLAGKEFVCLEPWTAPGNALNSGAGLIQLAPAETRELWMEIDCRSASSQPLVRERQDEKS